MSVRAGRDVGGKSKVTLVQCSNPASGLISLSSRTDASYSNEISVCAYMIQIKLNKLSKATKFKQGTTPMKNT